MKLWGGRFSKSTASLIEDFHSSIQFDQRLYRYDIQGSIAHARMLASTGIISTQEGEVIIGGLKQILQRIEAGEVEFSVEAEDIHMNIESLLIQEIGEVGKKLHTARSRNDQVATDTRLYLRHEIKLTAGLLMELVDALLAQAQAAGGAYMPGYTHLQPAQPILLAHHLHAYVEMFFRDLERLAEVYTRVDILPLGSGALAGVTYPIDREMVARELGFSQITANSLDGVSDRDFCIEYASTASLIMLHLSRLCEEIIIWNTPQFGFIRLDDAYSTGSSIMPQKKNPDIAELVRGKSGRVFGHLQGLLTMMKGLPLAYNKDMQEDKEALFDVVDTVKGCLMAFTPMLATASFNHEKMAGATKLGHLGATDLADYLAKKGIPFRRAHEIVGGLVGLAESKGLGLEELPLETLSQVAPEISADALEVLQVQSCLSAREVLGGTGPKMVESALKEAKRRINNLRENWR